MKPTARTRIRLLDGFGLTVGGREVEVTQSSQLVIALLASRDRPLERSVVAGTLWPGRSESRALACLRSALHRLNARAPVVSVSGNVLRLTDGVEVDLWEAQVVARDMLHGPVDDAAAEPLVELLARELLPDWDPVWLEAARQRHRVLRVRALELLSTALRQAGRHADAVDAARAAVSAEPDSETAEGALIAALVAEGNAALAIREFNHFRKRLWREFRVRPSLEMGDSVLRPGRARLLEVDATPSR